MYNEFHPYELEEAKQLAHDILGYPCPCESCSDDGGRAKSIEIQNMAFDLAGIDSYQLIEY